MTTTLSSPSSLRTHHRLVFAILTVLLASRPRLLLVHDVAAFTITHNLDLHRRHDDVVVLPTATSRPSGRSFHRHRSSTIISSSSSGFASQKNSNPEEYDDATTTPSTSTSTSTSGTSIGNVVQNLHGGKYQFSDTQYLAGSSFIGQQFAESLYASCDDDDYDSASEEEGGSLPKWAMQLQNATVQCNANKPILHTLIFDKQGEGGQKQKHQVLIKNEERSWERYYAFILPYYKEGTECSAGGDDHVHVANSASASSCFGITPNMGSLAPRGGASNVCDESKPYSDGALLSIEYANDDIQGKDGNEDDDDGVIEKNDEWLLVIGTEAEVWRYRLKVT